MKTKQRITSNPITGIVNRRDNTNIPGSNFTNQEPIGIFASINMVYKMDTNIHAVIIHSSIIIQIKEKYNPTETSVGKMYGKLS